LHRQRNASIAISTPDLSQINIGMFSEISMIRTVQLLWRRVVIPDSELQRTVIDALRWNPGIDARHLGVTVRDGTVTLSGYVKSYIQKQNTAGTVKHIAHVRTVIDDVELKLPDSEKCSDTELADAALELLELNVVVPDDRIGVTVDEGWVVLNGALDWHYQRIAAEDSIKCMVGLRGLINKISVKSARSPVDVESMIQRALLRNAQLDAAHITVVTMDGKAILAGTVRSCAEKEQAEAAAWSAPGISRVENRISIEP